MKTITVTKVQLQATLAKNLETHRQEFEKAWEGYRKRYIENVEAMLKAAKKGGRHDSLPVHVGLTVPSDHSEDYERAIEMLEWHTGKEMELTMSEFQQYVQDDWGWKGQFETTNAMYSGN